MNTDHQQQRDKLNWLAFQYVSGELDSIKHTQFEERLTYDLAACEAVAAMSELSTHMKLAVCDPVFTPASPTVAAVNRPRLLPQSIATGTTLAAICLIFAIIGQESAQEQETSVSSDEDVAGLIAGWSNGASEETLAEFIGYVARRLSSTGSKERALELLNRLFRIDGKTETEKAFWSTALRG